MPNAAAADAVVEELLENDMSMFAGAEPDDDDDFDTTNRGDEVHPDRTSPFDEDTTDEELASSPVADDQSDSEPGSDPETPDVADVDGETSDADDAGTEVPGDDDPGTVPEPPAAEVKDNNIQIPKWRLDQEARKRRALEKQIEEMQAAQQQAAPPEPQAPSQPAFDMKAEMAKALENVVEGDTDAAAEAMAQVLAQREAAIRNEVTQSVQQTTQQNSVQELLDTATAEITGEYEFLVQGHDDFDPTINAQIIGLRDALYNTQGGRNYHIGDALKEATETVLYRHRPDLFEQEQEAAPPPPPPKKTVQVDKKLKAAKAQAPKTAGAGEAAAPPSAPTVDIFNLTEDQFDSLTEAELKQMRGDFVG